MSALLEKLRKLIDPKKIPWEKIHLSIPDKPFLKKFKSLLLEWEKKLSNTPQLTNSAEEKVEVRHEEKLADVATSPAQEIDGKKEGVSKKIDFSSLFKDRQKIIRLAIYGGIAYVAFDMLMNPEEVTEPAAKKVAVKAGTNKNKKTPASVESSEVAAENETIEVKEDLPKVEESGPQNEKNAVEAVTNTEVSTNSSIPVALPTSEVTATPNPEVTPSTSISSDVPASDEAFVPNTEPIAGDLANSNNATETPTSQVTDVNPTIESSTPPDANPVSEVKSPESPVLDNSSSGDNSLTPTGEVTSPVVENTNTSSTAENRAGDLIDELFKESSKNELKDFEDIKVEKRPEATAAPDYDRSGRGLVYNCKGLHWACVAKENYQQCQQHYKFNQNENLPTDCYPSEVYKTEEDCRGAQSQKIDQLTPTDFCKK